MRSYHSKDWPWKSVRPPQEAKPMKVCKDNSIDANVWENGPDVEVLVRFTLSDLKLTRNETGYLTRVEKERLQIALKAALEKWELVP